MSYREAITLSVIFLSSCAHTETTLLIGPRYSEGDRQIAAHISVAYKFGKRGVCSWQHSSLPHRGEPFNDKPERVFDFVGCGVRINGD